jgi:ubiquinone/menaquinone biosynthesis C-methylase UbiE
LIVPVTDKPSSQEALSQRTQYAKGGITRWYWDFRDKKIFSLLDHSDRRIIDLGCGEGLTLQKLVSTFPESEITGIDLIEENIAICRKHGLPVQKGDLYDLTVPDETVDAVQFLEVLEHLDQPELAIAQIHRILKPGGKLVLLFPNDSTFKLARLMTFKFREAFYDPGHVKQWTPGEVKKLLTKAGFVVFELKSIPFLIWPISLHCLVAARKAPVPGR